MLFQFVQLQRAVAVGIELFEALGRSVSDLQIMMNEECNRPKSTDIPTSEETAQVVVPDLKTDGILFEEDTGIVIFDDPALFAEFAVEPPLGAVKIVKAKQGL